MVCEYKHRRAKSLPRTPARELPARAQVPFLPEDPEKHLRASAPAEAGIQVVEEHQAAV